MEALGCLLYPAHGPPANYPTGPYKCGPLITSEGVAVPELAELPFAGPGSSELSSMGDEVVAA